MNSTFDFKQISASMEMDVEDILHLMNLYQGEIQKDLCELEEGLTSANWPRIKSKLHKMKGDAANLCLDTLADLFAQMEHNVSLNDHNTLNQQFEHVKSLNEQLWNAFQQYCDEGV